MSAHIVYIAIIAILLLLLWMVWRAHISNSTILLNINCLVAEMFLDETRYQGLKLIFDAFIGNEDQPGNQREFDKTDFEKNRTYWLSSAYQVEKATQNLMLSETDNGYDALAHILNNRVSLEKK